MMEFSTGDAVQAINELGRWENATIISWRAADYYEVKFDGWD